MIQNARQVVSVVQVLTKNMKIDFNNLLIVPKDTSTINSRSEIHPFTSDGYLPLITAPMDTVVGRENSKVYEDNKINLCIPRHETTRNGFQSFSISWLSDMVDDDYILEESRYLVDVANGHMDSVLAITKKFKDKYPNTILMVGNVANPETYRILSDAGADYIRIGIGNGAGCFIENSIVKTKLGDKKIQDIEKGDLVLTHTGQYKEVISTIAYPSREMLIKINDTISTKTHEYYVLNKKYLNLVNDENIHDFAEWVKADGLTKEYFLLDYDENA